MRKLLALTTVALVLMTLIIAGVDYPAWAQAARTIRVVLTVPPGGSIDILFRLLADQISSTRGQTVLIESRPGAGGVIAAEAVARAAADGNTLLSNNNGTIISAILRKVNYDPLTSFEPICYLVRSPQLIVVNAASPYRSLADLMDAARGRPDELTLASAGPASSPQMAYEMLAHAAGIRMTYVPYPGSAPAVSALLGGHVTSVMAAYPNVAEQVKGGQLRALATASRTRIDSLADVPTLAESGYRDFEADLWYGMVAPARTSPETLSQLAGLFTAALQAPEIKPKLAVQGLYPVGACGADFAAHLRKQYDDYGRIIREANIKAE